MVEGTAGARDSVRLSVLWGDKLLDVKHVPAGAELTAGELFGESIAATGLSPETRLFADGGPLDNKHSARVGPLMLVADAVDAPPRVGPLAPPEDYGFFKIATITVMTFVAVLISMLLTPRDYVMDEDKLKEALTRVVHNAPPQVIDVTPKKKLAADSDAARGKEGKIGKEDSKVAHTDRSKKKGAVDVHDFGLLSAMKDGKAMKSLLEGGAGGGWNTAIGDLKRATAMGDPTGKHGMGSRGTEQGGGGTNDLSIGNTGTKDRGGVGGPGISLDPAAGKHPGPNGAQRVRVEGGLSKDQIAKVIRRHQSEIKYCYETQLQQHPELAGKVAVLFTIDGTGGVSEALVSESSLANETAEGCMLSKIRRWKFPEPIGGGIVTVNFPWIFSAAGSNAENDE